MTNINSFWIQNFNNSIIKNIDNFNLSVTNIIIILRIFLRVLIIYFFLNKNSISLINERDELELFWTIIPAIIILIISLPSIFLLYCYEENKFSFIDVKIIGNQWYWTYEYPNKIFTERYIKRRNIIRLINVNNSLIIPRNKVIRLIISSNDVLHSWTIPRLINKIDAIPGRLNIMFLNCRKRILLKGQCSEICGINHRFIPIRIIRISKYVKWLSESNNLLSYKQKNFFWRIYQIAPINWIIIFIMIINLYLYIYICIKKIEINIITIKKELKIYVK